jgi:hypothetical protein
MIVFLVSGLWHGAALNFMIWGALHGIYQIIGNILKPFREKVLNEFKIQTDKFCYKLLQILVTFVLVDFAWIFFRAKSFTDARILIQNIQYFNPWIFTNGSIYNLGLDQKEFLISILCVGVGLVVSILQRTKNLRVQLSKCNVMFRWATYVIAVVSILIFGIYGPGYSVQQFIYSQF